MRETPVRIEGALRAARSGLAKRNISPRATFVPSVVILALGCVDDDLSGFPCESVACPRSPCRSRGDAGVAIGRPARGRTVMLPPALPIHIAFGP